MASLVEGTRNLPASAGLRTSEFTRLLKDWRPKSSEASPHYAEAPTLSARVDTAREAVQEFSFVHPLIAQVEMNATGIHVLTGQDGCGKTTAALMLADYMTSEKDYSTYLTTRHTFKAALQDEIREGRLLILDDFLGHTFLDCLSEWRDVISLLNERARSRIDNLHILLVTRKSVLEKAWNTFGIDLVFFVKKCNTVELHMEPKQMLYARKIRPPQTLPTPSIGLPLCCALYPHIFPAWKPKFFLRPRAILLDTFRRLVEYDRVAAAALLLLSATEGYVNMDKLQEKVNPFQFLPESQNPSLVKIERDQWVERIGKYYRKNEGFLLIQDEYVSFANEAVREAALLALLERYKGRLQPCLSMRLISQLALCTSDETEAATEAKTEAAMEAATEAETKTKPVLTPAVRNVFVSQMKHEIRQKRFREVFTSPLLLHPSAASQFLEMFTDDLIKDLMGSWDEDRIPFLFWAGAFPALFERLPFSKIGSDPSAYLQWQTILTCCFWGHPGILQTFLNEAQAPKTGAFPMVDASFRPGSEPNWKNAPFNKKDNFLTTAAWRGHVEVVDVLLSMWKWKQLAYASGQYFRNILMHVAFRGEGEKLREYLQKDLNPKDADKFDMTPMHYAFCREEWNLPVEIIASLDDDEFKKRLGENALVLACENGWSLPQIQRVFSDKLSVSNPEVKKRCLAAAVVMDDLDVFQRLGSTVCYDHFWISTLTRNGCKVFDFVLDKIRELGSTDVQCIFVAACQFSEKPKVTAILKRFSTEPEVKVEGLKQACLYGNAAVVEALLPILRYDVPDEYLDCLAKSCCSLSLECLEMLLSTHKSIDMKSKDTMLQVALGRGSLRVVRRLFEWDPNLTRSLTMSQIHSAVMSDSPRVLDFWYNTFVTSRQPGSPALNIDVPVEEYKSPMVTACNFGNRRAASWLADHGANLFLEDEGGKNLCLEEAEKYGHEDLISVLRCLILRKDTAAEKVQESPVDGGSTSPSGGE